MITIYPDTNFLLIPGQFKVDIFAEFERIMDKPFEIIIIEPVYQELLKLSKTADKGADKAAASLAIQLINQKGLKREPTSEDYADDALARLASDGLIATQDQDLKRRIGEVITLIKKQYLKII